MLAVVLPFITALWHPSWHTSSD